MADKDNAHEYLHCRVCFHGCMVLLSIPFVLDGIGLGGIGLGVFLSNTSATAITLFIKHGPKKIKWYTCFGDVHCHILDSICHTWLTICHQAMSGQHTTGAVCSGG